jgi:preprotein translocase subunit SecE
MQKIIKFFKEVLVEFKNITWPKKDTLIQLTVVVISISIIISLILGGFDYLFTNSIGLIGNFKNQSPTPTKVDQSATPSIIALPTVASTAGKTNKK